MKKMTLEEIQSVSLDILKDVHAFCVRNDIHYSLAYGTLIGAIRHKGFIPWDDDIDIILPRPEYDRFCATYKSDNYVLFSNGKDHDGYMPAFARVCDCKRTHADMMFPFAQREYGIWIDVFPADCVSDRYGFFKKHYFLSKTLYAWENRARNSRIKFPCKNQSVYYNCKLLAKKIVTLNGQTALLSTRHQKKAAQIFLWGSTSHWSQLCCCDDGVRSYHEIEFLSDYLLMPFEDAEFFVMKGYDRFLRNIYGDYMQLPPIEQRQPRFHATVFYWK